ncbi:MAG: hypothetical protein VKK42_19950 [Lyngbya sp.]|nr:hypothetical protein [Lyngbya sp.]
MKTIDVDCDPKGADTITVKIISGKLPQPSITAIANYLTFFDLTIISDYSSPKQI